MNIPLVVIPDLPLAFDQKARDIMGSLNCHQLGIVQSFNPAKQTVVVQLCYKLVLNGKTQPAPVLVDVPIFVLGGGDRVVKVPIHPGDSCLVLFNDRDMDNWFTTGTAAVPASDRLHDLSDGLALVGFRSMANPVPAYSVLDTEVRNGPSRISVGEQLLLKNAATDLKMLLQMVVAALSQLNSVKSGGDATAAITIVTEQINLLLKSE